MINQDFKSIIELLKAFPDEQTCIDHLTELRWNGNIVSPFDSNSKVYVCKGNKYKCKTTGKYFNVKTSTLFDNTKIELQKWFLAIWLVTGHKKGISSLQLGRDIDTTQKTAWFMLQRSRNCFGIESEKMDGVVEADETYVGGKNANRHAVKKIKNSFGRSAKDKTPVFGLVNKGNVKTEVVPNTQGKTLKPIILSIVKKGSIVVTDQWHSYKGLAKDYQHEVISHKSGQYVRDGFHTNSIEGFWSLLKRGIIGIYHYTSAKHLQKYVDEFSFRYNTRTLGEAKRMNVMLSDTEHRLTYNQLIK